MDDYLFESGIIRPTKPFCQVEAAGGPDGYWHWSLESVSREYPVRHISLYWINCLPPWGRQLWETR